MDSGGRFNHFYIQNFIALVLRMRVQIVQAQVKAFETLENPCMNIEM